METDSNNCHFIQHRQEGRRKKRKKEKIGRAFGPKCEQTYLLACAPNEDSNQPAHPLSLIRVFVVRIKKLSIILYPKCAW